MRKQACLDRECCVGRGEADIACGYDVDCEAVADAVGGYDDWVRAALYGRDGGLERVDDLLDLQGRPSGIAALRKAKRSD